MTRITPAMTASQTLNDLNGALERLQTTSSQMSSGLRITKPSDDPYGASLAVQLNGQLAGLNSYNTNINDGSSWNQQADSSLTSMNNVIQRVRELVVEASNGTLSTSDRANAADEVDQLTEQLKTVANTTYNGSYIFSGTATTTPPYGQGAGNDTYQGDNGQVLRQIGPGTTVQVNVDMSQLLGNGQTANDGKLLDVLRNVSADMRAGTAASLQSLSTTDLNGIDQNMGTLEQMQASVGAVGNRLTLSASRLQGTQVTVTQQLANTQNADIAQVVTDYSNEQASYTAALRAGANIVQSSLLDFLSSS